MQEIHHWSTVKRLVRINIGTKAEESEIQVAEIAFIRNLGDYLRKGQKIKNTGVKQEELR